MYYVSNECVLVFGFVLSTTTFKKLANCLNIHNLNWWGALFLHKLKCWFIKNLYTLFEPLITLTMLPLQTDGAARFLSLEMASALQGEMKSQSFNFQLIRLRESGCLRFGQAASVLCGLSARSDHIFFSIFSLCQVKSNHYRNFQSGR